MNLVNLPFPHMLIKHLLLKNHRKLFASLNEFKTPGRTHSEDFIKIEEFCLLGYKAV
jgi:hypothetical protein